MHRQHLTTLLTNYHSLEHDEQQSKSAMLAFLEANADCFERSCVSGHFTASAWLLDKSAEHALLMHHAKLHLWTQLGGHCDGDPNLLAVALKEAQEESGIEAIAPLSDAIFDLDIHQIPAYKDEPAHLHYDVRFLLHVQSDESVIANHESNELRWIAKDEQLLPTQERSITRMFHKWLKHQ